jgi:hypothetical protein
MHRGLRFTLAACEARRNKFIGNPHSQKDFNIFFECKGCEGPIPIGQKKEEPTMEAERPNVLAARKGRPCSKCGRTPDQTEFFPSRKDKCKECIKALMAENRSKQKPTWTPVEDDSSAKLEAQGLTPEVSAEIDAQPDRMVAICSVCFREFEPWRNGTVLVRSKCHDCMSDAISESHRRRLEAANQDDAPKSPPNFVLRLDFRRERDLYVRLAKIAVKERRALEAQVFVFLEKILLTGGSDE